MFQGILKENARQIDRRKAFQHSQVERADLLDVHDPQNAESEKTFW